MLAGMEAIKKGRPGKMSHDATFNLSDLGLARETSSRWQSIASIPEAVFETFIRETAARAGWAPWRAKGQIRGRITILAEIERHRVV